MEFEVGQAVEEFYSDSHKWVSTYLILQVDYVGRVVEALCLGESEDHGYTGGHIVKFPFTVFTDPPESYWKVNEKSV
jgi:hypothetical protein